MGFILAYLGLFIPGSVIRYQVIVEPTEANGLSKQQINIATGYLNLAGDRDGSEVFPCDFGVRGFVPSSSFIWLHSIWQLFGKMLLLYGFGYGIWYAAYRKMPLGIFALLLALMAGIPIAILESFSDATLVWCDPATSYRVVSFAPYWPATFIWVMSAYLVNRGRRLLGFKV